jgi:hypothetical protein
MRTPTMSTIKRAFDSAFDQPMVFDEEVTSAGTIMITDRNFDNVEIFLYKFL